MDFYDEKAELRGTNERKQDAKETKKSGGSPEVISEEESVLRELDRSKRNYAQLESDYQYLNEQYEKALENKNELLDNQDVLVGNINYLEQKIERMNAEYEKMIEENKFQEQTRHLKKIELLELQLTSKEEELSRIFETLEEKRTSLLKIAAVADEKELKIHYLQKQNEELQTNTLSSEVELVESEDTIHNLEELKTRKCLLENRLMSKKLEFSNERNIYIQEIIKMENNIKHLEQSKKEFELENKMLRSKISNHNDAIHYLKTKLRNCKKEKNLIIKQNEESLQMIMKNHRDNQDAIKAELAEARNSIDSPTLKPGQSLYSELTDLNDETVENFEIQVSRLANYSEKTNSEEIIKNLNLELSKKIAYISKLESEVERLQKELLSRQPIPKQNLDLQQTEMHKDSEFAIFASIINQSLESDPDLEGTLPINPNKNDLLSACKNGILLCKLVNIAVPETIFERAINIQPDLSSLQVEENVNLAINAARSIGCNIPNIDPEHITNLNENCISTVLWEIIKIIELSPINLKNYPELIRLEKAGESASDLLVLSPEALLLRWFNYFLRNAGHPRKVKNFGEDIKDGESYTLLIDQLSPTFRELNPFYMSNLEKRVSQVIINSKKLGVRIPICSKDITGANTKINLLFTASIFKANSGLETTKEELTSEIYLLNGELEETREERAYRIWLNSLNPEEVHIENLYKDIEDGLAILKIIDTIRPGSVNWKQVEKTPNHPVKKISNGKMIVQIGKALNFKLQGTDGRDIVHGNKNLILGYFRQLQEFAALELVAGMDRDSILTKANELSGDTTVSSFKDKKLSSGRYLLNLFASVDSNSVNWELVTPGDTAEEKKQNAEYVLSVARKLGVSVFGVWEDIVEVKPKMTMTLIAAAIKLANRNK